MDWLSRQDDLARLARRQLFFVGGAPRSGTTWLQQMLDSHPDISCRGEGLFWQHLAVPLQAMADQRNRALESKNAKLFGHTGGYRLTPPEDVHHLLGTAILLALDRQSAEAPCRAVGEKTPENVFLFERLKALFPRAKFIAIARDPRDVLTSAWHFFQVARPGGDEIAAKTDFIRSALPSLAAGAREMIAFGERHPADLMTVTYEGLRQDAAPILADLARFLGVSDEPDTVRDCVARTSFAALTGGRPAGVAQDGAFLRKGVAGDWTSTLTAEMGALIVRELGWMFPHFGWRP